jgi:(heptosyl)LPS beta-1,4-glucosyltransferase
MKLVGIILTYNEAAHVVACIQSLRFADQIIVFDSLSTDDTVQLAQANGAQVIQRRFDNYAGQRNAALDAVEGSAEWVLFVDADERVTPELAAEIRTVLDDPAYAGWRIPRHNFIFGKVTRGAGWYPDFQTRLLRVGMVRYDPTWQVHERVLLDRAEGTLQNHFIHYNYQDFAQFVRKQQRYTAYDAKILFEDGIRPKPQNFILQPWRQFWWRFVTLKGYIDGWHGFRLSVLMAWYEWRKYMILMRLWRDQGVS